MQRPNFFLRTKLLPPRPVSDLLSRPRLLEKLHNNIAAPITLVTANAGCGKTTLVADFIRQQPREFVWYQLDHTDADPFVFLGYICRGIKKIRENFGENLLPYLTEGSEELLRVPERAIDLLLNEILDTLEQPFVLVLDDYHHIGRETIVHKLVDRLLQYGSDMLHVLITSRDMPPLAIVRRRTQGGALVITRDELLFTDDEMRELFRRTLNIELKPADVREYQEKTGGWITALQLVRQVVEGQQHAGDDEPHLDLREILRQSEKDIFDYFAEEVFTHETGETQQLLMYLSLLDSLPLDVCSRLFPALRTAARLPELLRRNVFLTVAGDEANGRPHEVYRFHPLFRDFLARHLRQIIGRAAVNQEKTRIAEFFAARAQWEKALSYLLEAEDYNRAAELIAERGDEWIAAGAITALGTLTDKVPLEFLEQHPRALLNRAEIAKLQGDFDKANKLLTRAVKLLRSGGDVAAEAEALHSSATIARRQNRLPAAFELLAQSENLAADFAAVRMKCENTRGLCLVQQGEFAAAERQFRLALELAEQLNDEKYIRLTTNNLALPYGLRGDFGEALRWLRRVYRADKSDHNQPTDAVGHLNAARMHIYLGELTESEPHLERALELCQLYNLRVLGGEVLEAYGNYYREKRDYPHAVEFYERARRTYDDCGVAIETRELQEEIAQMTMRRGDLNAARQLLEKLLAERRRQNLSTEDINRARLYLCQVELLANERADSVGELTEIADYFHERGYLIYETQAAFLLAAAHFAARQNGEMRPALARALDLSARYDYDYWLRGAIKQHGAMFADEAAFELLPVDLRAVVENVRPPTILESKSAAIQNAASESVITVAAPVVDLTLKLLGHVEIFRDPSKPFASDAWTTRRARDIFCCIATSKHRRMEKETVIETFWGESELGQIEKNFHPTISHIRKALNSRQTVKQNFLLYRDAAYLLNSELTYSIDAEEFESLIAAAEIAKRDKDENRFRANLEAAEKLYRGDFMIGVYDDWAEQRRQHFQEQQQRVLKALAKIAFQEKNWSTAVKYAAELLRRDPYQEEIHRLLMRVYHAQGKRAAVKEQFDALQKLLKQELGIEPSTETRRAYQGLIERQ